MEKTTPGKCFRRKESTNHQINIESTIVFCGLHPKKTDVESENHPFLKAAKIIKKPSASMTLASFALQCSVEILYT